MDQSYRIVFFWDERPSTFFASLKLHIVDKTHIMQYGFFKRGFITSHLRSKETLVAMLRMNSGTKHCIYVKQREEDLSTHC